MLKKTIAAVGVATMASAGTMASLPDALAKSATASSDLVQVASCNPCNPCAAAQ